MAQTHVQPGKTMTYTNGTGSTIVSGTPVKVGTRLGIASTDIVDGGAGDLLMEEVHSLPKAAVAVSQGNKAYWDDTAKKITNVATANILVGVFWSDAADVDADVPVKLNCMNA
nr:DUF2190 family protein [uncultured Pseudodesulfovibrio sp.]